MLETTRRKDEEGSLTQLIADLDMKKNRKSSMTFLGAALTLLFALSPVTGKPVDLKINPSASAVTFKVGSFWGNVDGRFNRWDSTVLVSPDFSHASGMVTIQIASIDTGNEGRDDHLRNPDFFASQQFPTATYRLEAIASENNTVTTDGTLTIRGVSRPLKIVFRKQASDSGVRLHGSFTLNRKDFGVDYDSVLNPIDDNVTVNLSVLLAQ
ncbi:MAG: hypothetical protein CMN76_16285 [Spirochaetaceae bacterium]|nr:hypothetical protein [Spirochaetaceae bacterium]|tara:strand:- start:10914 stop:11546 length:633 start_codon:yes stop_codon:yes gene_type:complete